ncbi:MAG: hypothetical protein U1C46_11215, partial [Bacteroidales bacterium]|nr:hypothetical protein [Bacteroidales bacterium]
LAIIRLLFLFASREIVFNHPDEFGRVQEVDVNVAHFIINDIRNDEIVFENHLYQQIFDEYAFFILNNEFLSDHYFTSHKDITVRNLAIELMSTAYELSENWKENKIYINGEVQKLREAVTSSLLALKAKKINKLLLAVQQSLKNEKDDTEVLVLMQKHKTLKKLLIQINKQLGRIITP